MKPVENEHHKLKLSSATYQELLASMAPEWRFIDEDGGLVLISPQGDRLHFLVKTIVDELEARQKAFDDAVSAGDLKEMERLAPKGPTYSEVVKPRTQDEQKRMIDTVNKARGVQ
jgi:hypothetical protein